MKKVCSYRAEVSVQKQYSNGVFALLPKYASIWCGHVRRGHFGAWISISRFHGPTWIFLSRVCSFANLESNVFSFHPQHSAATCHCSLFTTQSLLLFRSDVKMSPCLSCCRSQTTTTTRRRSNLLFSQRTYRCQRKKQINNATRPGTNSLPLNMSFIIVI